MSGPDTLAVFGGAPAFASPIPAGQHWFPAWAQYEAIFRDIFARQYYTNQGPLAQELERRLAERLGVRHAVCVANEFIGLVSAGQALDVKGDVVVPAHCPAATPLTLEWTGARPRFCDVDAESGMMTAEQVAPLLDRKPASAILAVNPWGDACDVTGLQALAARHRIPLYFDSAHGFGCAVADRSLGGFGDIEVISFHSDNVLGSCEGAVMCIRDDALAARARNIRSSYGMGAPVPVAKTANGRMSEAQAALALFNLDHYEEHQQRNERLFERLQTGLAGIDGLSVRVPGGVTRSNHQNLICLVDEAAFGMSRDDLWQVLRRENVLAGRGFHPGSHRACADLHVSPTSALPNTERFCATTLELPTNHALAESDAQRLVELLAIVRRHAGAIKRRLAESA